MQEALGPTGNAEQQTIDMVPGVDFWENPPTPQIAGTPQVEMGTANPIIHEHAGEAPAVEVAPTTVEVGSTKERILPGLAATVGSGIKEDINIPQAPTEGQKDEGDSLSPNLDANEQAEKNNNPTPSEPEADVTRESVWKEKVNGMLGVLNELGIDPSLGLGAVYRKWLEHEDGIKLWLERAKWIADAKRGSQNPQEPLTFNEETGQYESWDDAMQRRRNDRVQERFIEPGTELQSPFTTPPPSVRSRRPHDDDRSLKNITEYQPSKITFLEKLAGLRRQLFRGADIEPGKSRQEKRSGRAAREAGFGNMDAGLAGYNPSEGEVGQHLEEMAKQKRYKKGFRPHLDPNGPKVSLDSTPEGPKSVVPVKSDKIRFRN